MPNDFQSITPIRRTRLPHVCQWCAHMIIMHSAACRVSGRIEGSMCTFYVHEDCGTAWQRDPCNDDLGCPFDHWRGMTCAETEEARWKAREQEKV